MQEQLDTVKKLGQGQRVRLTFEDGDPVEVRANQMEYDPETRLRVEFTTDEAGDYGRYQADAHVEGGQWTALNVHRYDREDRKWINLGKVMNAIPSEMFQSMRSSDMDAQQDTGYNVGSPPDDAV